MSLCVGPVQVTNLLFWYALVHYVISWINNSLCRNFIKYCCLLVMWEWLHSCCDMFWGGGVFGVGDSGSFHIYLCLLLSSSIIVLFGVFIFKLIFYNVTMNILSHSNPTEIREFYAWPDSMLTFISFVGVIGSSNSHVCDELIIYWFNSLVFSGTAHPNSRGLFLAPCIPWYVSAGFL